MHRWLFSKEAVRGLLKPSTGSRKWIVPENQLVVEPFGKATVHGMMLMGTGQAFSRNLAWRRLALVPSSTVRIPLPRQSLPLSPQHKGLGVLSLTLSCFATYASSQVDDTYAIINLEEVQQAHGNLLALGVGQVNVPKTGQHVFDCQRRNFSSHSAVTLPAICELVFATFGLQLKLG